MLRSLNYSVVPQVTPISFVRHLLQLWKLTEGAAGTSMEMTELLDRLYSSADEIIGQYWQSE